MSNQDRFLIRCISKLLGVSNDVIRLIASDRDGITVEYTEKSLFFLLWLSNDENDNDINILHVHNVLQGRTKRYILKDINESYSSFN